APEEEHLALLGFMNSSAACFWLKQVLHDKGGGGIGGGIATEAWEHFYVHNASGIEDLPIPDILWPEHAREIDALASELRVMFPHDVRELSSAFIAAAKQRQQAARMKMFSLQEELDWNIYEGFGLTPALGQTQF